MAKRAIAARIQGDDYQARWFWFQVCRLFSERTKVVRVGYEANNIKSFDDVVVYYKGMQDDEGNPLNTEYHQVKFHVTSAGAFTYKGMMNPAFINATSVSILQRLKNAQTQYAPNGTEAHFILYSPWQIDPDDRLAQVHSKTDGRLDWHRLAEGGSNSLMGKLRAEWREHLSIETDEELCLVLRPLRILQGRTLKEIGDWLNDKLYRAGLLPIEEGRLCNSYDELARRLIQSEKTEFTRADIEAICKRENLWLGHSIVEPDVYRLGIRSFLRWAEHLEDETDAMLDLLRYFNGRSIRSLDLWQTEIYPSVDKFLTNHLRFGQRCHLHLHTHASIAFASGYCLNSKSGIDVALTQSTGTGREIWRPSPCLVPNQYPAWTVTQESMVEDGTDVAIALSVTHSVASDVQAYIALAQLPIHRIFFYMPSNGANSQAIVDATHAKLLADQLSARLRSDRTILERQGKLHIFVAAPNALVFFIGQLARSFGSCIFYEYDFDQNTPGAYQPSLMFPPL
ncbi:SAVED domain-containing protein (plasmid) [Nostoc sp. UHCC 0302]|uniref:SAVED domain-containing protein n=1 Tax=Nostoc sp. UHCC 0302 TaxID=3134896 RepID=UPI00311C8D10